MFEITDSAAKQFKASAELVGDDALSLRVTAKRSDERGVVYNMGFDEPAENDISFCTNGVSVVVDTESAEIVTSMVIDYRKFEGLEQFVFMNPNDKSRHCESSSSERDAVCAPRSEG
jgi:iron-sulfur cluster assembly accessory protein